MEKRIRRPATDLEKEAARRMYLLCDDDVECDPDAKASEGSGGVWVEAWLWIPAEELEA